MPKQYQLSVARYLLLLERLPQVERAQVTHGVDELDYMIGAHFFRLDLIKKVAKLLELVGDSHSELVIAPLAVKGLHVHLYLCPYIFPL